MYDRTNRVTAFILLALVVLVMVSGCSRDNPIGPTQPSQDPVFRIGTDPDSGNLGEVISDIGPPAEGIVVEGVSAPGIELGFTRTQVEASYGLPYWVYQGAHRYRIDGQIGHEVHVYYGDGYGGPPNNLPDDIVTSVSWTTAVTGWVTTAGVNTTLARNDPEAVIAIYPDAQVTYYYDGQFIASIMAWEQGFSVRRTWDFYSGTVFVALSIFNPRPAPPPPPPPEEITYVYEIDLSSNKVKGKRNVVGLVGVRDHTHRAAVGATVFAEWTMPDGSAMPVERATSSSGFAYFQINNARRGNYTLTITDVVLEDHRFDRENSVLTGNVYVR
jgi:hypothetical protein